MTGWGADYQPYLLLLCIKRNIFIPLGSCFSLLRSHSTSASVGKQWPQQPSHELNDRWNELWKHRYQMDASTGNFSVQGLTWKMRFFWNAAHILYRFVLMFLSFLSTYGYSVHLKALHMVTYFLVKQVICAWVDNEDPEEALIQQVPPSSVEDAVAETNTGTCARA